MSALGGGMLNAAGCERQAGERTCKLRGGWRRRTRAKSIGGPDRSLRANAGSLRALVHQRFLARLDTVYPAEAHREGLLERRTMLRYESTQTKMMTPAGTRSHSLHGGYI